MMNKILTYVVQLILLAVLVFGLHYILQQVLGVLGDWNDTGYNLFLIYLFELMLSIILVVGIVVAGKFIPSSLGYVFLVLMSLKCGASYIFIQPALEPGFPTTFVKHNFLIVFFIFLLFDVYVAYRVLNKENMNTAE